MAREELKSVLYASAANLIGLLVSLVAGLIVPKFISDINYGYWQLYILYTSYAGFMHFGLQDGIYLRLGGKNYAELNKGLLHGQLMTLTVFEILLTGICVRSHGRVLRGSEQALHHPHVYAVLLHSAPLIRWNI